jgi:hypothetical protein
MLVQPTQVWSSALAIDTPKPKFFLGNLLGEPGGQLLLSWDNCRGDMQREEGTKLLRRTASSSNTRAGKNLPVHRQPT